MTTRPLDGLRVVDLADEKGELAGRLLADFGADVSPPKPEADKGETRHVQGRKKVDAELPDASPGRRGESASEQDPGLLLTLMWVLATLFIFVAALAVLARLPPLE